MAKTFGASLLMGIILSITGILITIYTSPKEIPLQYIVGGIILISILIIVSILIDKFSKIDNELKKVKENSDKIEDLNKRFKNIEDLDSIRLDIRDLQKKVFKR